MNITNHTESPYFERLPRYARPALQAAWDKAHGKHFGIPAIYRSFCLDMDEIGYEKPSREIMTDWILRVQQGNVARPGSEADGADPAFVASLEEVLAEPIEEIVEQPVALDPEPPVLVADSPVLKLFATPADVAPQVEEALAEARANLRKELQTACLDGVDDLTDAVVTRAHKLAREMMIEILRDLAAEMEAAA